MPSKKQSSAKTAAEVGAGVLAAAAAAGAGYYFYGSDRAKQHRAAASKWAKSMKEDVVKETKKLKKIDQKQVAKIVDRAAAMYASARSVNPQELRAAATELKKNWRRVGQEIAGRVNRSKPAKSAKKTAKKGARKAAPKKAAKKASKKAVKSTKKRSR